MGLEELERALIEEMRLLPPDDQITFHSWADKWQEWTRQYGRDPLTFDFDAALCGVYAFSAVLDEGLHREQPKAENLGRQVATTLALMHRRQQEAST